MTSPLSPICTKFRGPDRFHRPARTGQASHSGRGHLFTSAFASGAVNRLVCDRPAFTKPRAWPDQLLSIHTNCQHTEDCLMLTKLFSIGVLVGLLTTGIAFTGTTANTPKAQDDCCACCMDCELCALLCGGCCEDCTECKDCCGDCDATGCCAQMRPSRSALPRRRAATRRLPGVLRHRRARQLPVIAPPGRAARARSKRPSWLS